MENNNIETFKRIQKEIEEAKMQSGILKGKLLSLSSQLKKYGFKSIKDAQIRIPKLKTQLEKQEREFKNLINQFESKYFIKRD